MKMRERNPSSELSISTSSIKQTLERKKEFDKRVSDLSKEFNTLDRTQSKIITQNDLIDFFQANVKVI